MDIDQALQTATKRAIADSLSRQNLYEDGHNKLMFRLCQYLLAVPGARELISDELEPYALAFFNACREHAGAAWSEQWAISEFFDLWDHGKVKHPKGFAIMESIEKARSLPTPPELEHYTDQRLLLLAKFCRVLAENRRQNGRFFLSHRDAAKVIGMSVWCAGVAIHRLCRDGIIREVKPADRAHRKAPEYKYTAPCAGGTGSARGA
jgi:hypothetical protein